jgi:acyl-coenzyme A thioesterase PaaI-like protein
MSERPVPDFGVENRRGIGMAHYLPMPIVEIGDGSAPLPTTRGVFTPPSHVVDADGRLETGMLASLTDSIGGMTSGLACLPDWIVTTNLSLRRAPDALDGPRGTGGLVVDTQVMRRGRSSVVTRSTVTDEAGHVVGTSWVTCAVLTPADGPPPFTRPVRLNHHEPDPDPMFRLDPAQFFALTAGARPGQVLLYPAQHLRNPWGILHGGAVAHLLDSAARAVVAGRPEPGPTPGIIVSDLVIHYMNPGRDGPIIAEAAIIGSHDGDVMVRVTAHDSGADNRLMNVAVMTVRVL